ncbi:con-Ins Im2-like [Littorina saxatilis]|uniref:Insulin-like domain-containing protein n=1 Tax=Littorina saxatilis TaxID=31220 RepID=A0AAN9BIQ7_9CAEN
MVTATMAATTQCHALLVLWVLALQVSTAAGGYEHTCDLNTRLRGAHSGGVCGRRLASLVAMLCEDRGHAGRYNHPDKRSVRDTTGLVDERLRGILLNKREALSYLNTRVEDTRVARGARAKRRSGVQGITCECCYNVCSMNELYEYCK